jgi:hypothetical protein
MYGAPTCFGITLPSSGSVPSAFWEMLNSGAVDRMLWMGVLFLVTLWVHTQYANPQYSTDCSSIEHLSEGIRNAALRWQCNAETCRSSHTQLINWMKNCFICWFFHAYINEMRGSRSKIPSKNSRQAALRNGFNSCVKGLIAILVSI